MSAGRTRAAIKARLKEPSTWAGFAAIFTAGVHAWATRDPAAIGAVIAGVAAVVIPERGK